MLTDGMPMRKKMIIKENKHLDDIDFALLKAEIEFGKILSPEEMREYWNHIDNCPLCRDRLLYGNEKENLLEQYLNDILKILFL